MKKENLPTEELLKMISSFEHYPSVTEADDRAYILAYLEDEACSISENDITEWINDIEITAENIHLYYEFISDDDLKGETLGWNALSYIVNVFSEYYQESKTSRSSKIKEHLNLSIKDFMQNKQNTLNDKQIKVGHVFFGVKDILAPIDEYIAEIKASDKYKEYVISLSNSY